MAKNTSPRKVELPYKCPKTGLRFADEEAAAEYAKVQARKKRAAKRRANLEATYDRLVAEPRLQATSFEDLARRMEAVLPELLRVERQLNGGSDRCSVKSIQFRLSGCRPARLNEDKYNRPLAEHPQTALRLSGDIQVLWSKPPSFGFNPQQSLAGLFPFLHTGCGGMRSVKGEGAVATYELTLCLDDFPLIWEAYAACEAQEAAEQTRQHRIEARVSELFAESPAADALVAAANAAEQAMRVAQQEYQEALAKVAELKAELTEQVSAVTPDTGPRLVRPF